MQNQSPPNSTHTPPDQNGFTPLDIARLRRELKTAEIGHTIEYAVSIPTTMTLASALARGARQSANRTVHGCVALAEEQTAGRGRRGRVWSAAKGRSLLLTVVLAPPWLAAHAMRLPMVCGLAALDAVEAVAPGLRPRLALKWPNDLIVMPTAPQPPDAIEKVAGILIEHISHSPASYALAGIGINANQTAAELPPVAPPALPPTSIRLALGSPVDRTRLAIELCRSLALRLSLAAHTDDDTDAASIVRQWRDRLYTLGRPVQVYPLQGAPYSAIARDVTPHGDLVVEDAHGAIHTLIAGDVSIRPAPTASGSMD